MKYVVPYAYWISDDNYVAPNCEIVEADSPSTALEKAMIAIAKKDPGHSIWHYKDDENSNEEGYVLGDPTELA